MGGHHCDNTVALSSCHSSPRWAGAIPDPIPEALGELGRGGGAGKGGEQIGTPQNQEFMTPAKAPSSSTILYPVGCHLMN